MEEDRLNQGEERGHAEEYYRILPAENGRHRQRLTGDVVAVEEHHTEAENGVQIAADPKRRQSALKGAHAV